MKNPITSAKGGCPSIEELNALHDGQGSPAVAEHTAACAACQETLRACREVDAMVARAVNPPAALSARIKAACRAEAARRRKPMVMWPGHAWHLAAAAAACAAVVALLVMVTEDGAEQKKAVRTARVPSPSAAKPAAVPSPSVAKTPAAVPVRPAPKTIRTPATEVVSEQGQGIRPVGLTWDANPYLNGATDMPGVGDFVRHVWVVRDSAAAAAFIRQNLPRHSVLHDLSTNGRNLYRLIIPDVEMQTFVDRLAGAGYSLVSPSLPQPGATQPLNTFGKPVVYTVEIVPEAK